MHLSDDEADSNLMSLSKPELFAMTSGIKSLIVQCFTPLCGTLLYSFVWNVVLHLCVERFTWFFECDKMSNPPKRGKRELPRQQTNDNSTLWIINYLLSIWWADNFSLICFRDKQNGKSFASFSIKIKTWRNAKAISNFS